MDAWVLVHDPADEQSRRGIICLRALLLLIYQASCLIDQFVHNVNARIVVSDHPDEQSGCGIVCV